MVARFLLFGSILALSFGGCDSAGDASQIRDANGPGADAARSDGGGPTSDAVVESDAAPADAARTDAEPAPDGATDGATDGTPVENPDAAADGGEGDASDEADAAIEPDVCSDDEECLGERVCRDGRCVNICHEDADCPGSRRCVEGRCPEPEVCNVPEDCDPGRVCAAGTCVDRCGANAPCAGDQICDAETGLCVEAGECQADDDCAGDRICVNGECVDPCHEDADCPGTRACDGLTGHCPEPDFCFAAEDCDAGRVCVDAACQAGCDLAGQLPDGQLPAEQCPDGQICRDGICVDDRCEENVECPAACVDGRCAEVPAACAPDAPCAEPLVCVALGACVLDGACEADGDCPALAPRCAPDAGRCVICLADADCAGAQRCVDGVCHLDGPCNGDGDCPGTRTCEDGECTPAACAGDAFDAADGPVELAARTFTGLILCDGTEDFYRVEAGAGEGLRVVLRHAPDAGDLSLAVLDPSAPALRLPQSDDRYGLERVEVGPAPRRRSVDVIVSGRPGFDVTYALTVERLPAGACAVDDFEGLLGNDDAGHAAPLAPGVYAHTLCPGDEDWFALDLPAGSRLTAREAPAAVALTLLDPGGAVLAEAAPEGDARVLAADVPAGGRYALRARSADPGASPLAELEITVRAAADAEAAACADPPQLLPGEATPIPRATPVDRFELSCARLPEADFVAGFALATAQVVTVTAEGAAAGAPVALRRDCADVGTELACASGEVRDVALPAGDYSVIVDAPAGAVRLTLTAPCRNDGDCEGALICGDGVCQAPCNDDRDCAGGGRCDAQSGRCAPPECRDNADCDGVCVEGRCEAPPFAGCDAQRPCPGGQICAPVSVCAAAGACDADADCPIGAPRCDGDGACVSCRDDGDCAPAEFCWAARCAFLGDCGGDGDCPGTRRCADGFCEPAGDCEGDRFDGLREPPLLEASTYAGLMLCDQDEDLYRVALPANRGLRIALRHEAGEGDLSLTVTDPRAQDAEVGSSDGTSGVEVFGVRAAPDDRELEIAVRGRLGFSVAYALLLDELDAGACVNDPHEGPLGNDERDRAAPLDVGSTWLLLCPDDVDFFALRLPAGALLSARAEALEGGRPLALTITDPAGAPLGQAARDDGGWAASATTAGPGRYGIRVAAAEPGPAVAVRLDVDAAPAENAAALACASAIPLRAGEATPLPAHLFVDRFATSCGAGGEDVERVATFELDAPAQVTVQVTGGRFGTAVALRADCEDPAREVACDLGDDAVTLAGLALDAGRYAVIVETGGGTPRVRFDVR